MHSSSLLLVMVFVGLAWALGDNVPDFVTQGKCPVLDEQRLWQQQVPHHSKLGGIWYQYALTDNPYQPLDQCVRHEYIFDGKSFDATSTGISAEGELLKITGEIAPMPLGDPHLMVAFEDSFAAPLVILETDYSNYACLYSCMDFSLNYHTDFSFIFTRDTTPSESYVRKCEAAFRAIGMDTSRLSKTLQGSACPYDTQKAL